MNELSGEDVVAEAQAAGRSIFLSSHNLTEVERTCDRVGIIREGRLVEVSTVADLLGEHWRSVNLVLAEVPPTRARRLRRQLAPGGSVNRGGPGSGTVAGGAVMAIRTIREQDGRARPGPTTEQVWQAVTRASFAVISHVTPAGEPRCSGVAYKVAGDKLVVLGRGDSLRQLEAEAGK